MCASEERLRKEAETRLANTAYELRCAQTELSDVHLGMEKQDQNSWNDRSTSIVNDAPSEPHYIYTSSLGKMLHDARILQRGERTRTVAISGGTIQEIAKRINGSEEMRTSVTVLAGGNDLCKRTPEQCITSMMELLNICRNKHPEVHVNIVPVPDRLGEAEFNKRVSVFNRLIVEQTRGMKNV